MAPFYTELTWQEIKASEEAGVKNLVNGTNLGVLVREDFLEEVRTR